MAVAWQSIEGRTKRCQRPHLPHRVGPNGKKAGAGGCSRMAGAGLWGGSFGWPSVAVSPPACAVSKSFTILHPAFAALCPPPLTSPAPQLLHCGVPGRHVRVQCRQGQDQPHLAAPTGQAANVAAEPKYVGCGTGRCRATGRGVQHTLCSNTNTACLTSLPAPPPPPHQAPRACPMSRETPAVTAAVDVLRSFTPGGAPSPSSPS